MWNQFYHKLKPTCVYPHMHFQIGLVCESLPANLTLVRFLTRVCSHVQHQIMVFREDFIANRASGSFPYKKSKSNKFMKYLQENYTTPNF